MYQIIIEFPNKKIADEWCGQMSDGFGEDYCDFSHWYQLPNTDDKSKNHYIKKYDEHGRQIFYINNLTI